MFRSPPRTHLQMARRLMNIGSIHPFDGPIIPFGAEVSFHPISAKYYGRVHQFGSKVLPEIFMVYALNAWRSKVVIYLWRMRKIQKQCHPIFTSKKSSNQKSEHPKERDNEFVCPCRTGEILQEGQPSFTAACKEACDLKQEFGEQTTEEGRKPEIQVQILKLDKISGVWWELTDIGIMLLQGRNSRFLKTIFPIPLHYNDVQRENKNKP